MFNLNKFKNDPKKYVENISIEELEHIIQYLSEKYYVGGKSIVPDKIYDWLLLVLEKRDSSNKLLREVGFKEKRSVKLPIYAGSLEKIKPDSNNVEKWTNKFQGPYIVSDKLDGISCVMIKKQFGFKIYTRGDGKYGSDITHLSKYILKEINVNDIPINTIVRGELIISKKNFETIKDKMENARNAVSGLINAKKINVDVARIINYVTYNLYHLENEMMTQKDQLLTLLKYGFDTVSFKQMKTINNGTLSTYLVLRRKNSEYDVDGIVVVDNSMPYEIEEGYPKYAFAFKSILTNEEAEVQVEEVEWNISKDGYIKPKIKIIPIKLSGVTISSLTGFCAKFIYDNKIGPGSILKIIRSGDVIPHIKEVVEWSINNAPQMPDIPYEWNKTKVDIIIQNTDNNREMTIKRLVYFFKKIGVKNIDDKTVEKLVDNNIDTVYKIISTDSNKLYQINGLGSTIVTKIKQNIMKKLTEIDMNVLMAASQCFGRGISLTKIKKIRNVIPDVLYLKIEKDELINKVANIDGFGEKTAEQFVFGIEKFNEFFKEISEFTNIQSDKLKTNNTNKLFKNEIIVFTGVRRKDIEEFIKNNGGEVAENITKNTTILIHKDDMVHTNKIQHAKKNGTEIISLTNFIKLHDIK